MACTTKTVSAGVNFGLGVIERQILRCSRLERTPLENKIIYIILDAPRIAMQMLFRSLKLTSERTARLNV
jgi:hypothetical protein